MTTKKRRPGRPLQPRFVICARIEKETGRPFLIFPDFPGSRYDPDTLSGWSPSEGHTTCSYQWYLHESKAPRKAKDRELCQLAINKYVHMHPIKDGLELMEVGYIDTTHHYRRHRAIKEMHDASED